MLSYEQVMHFNAFGFLKIPQLFTPDEVAAIVRESKEIIVREAPAYDGTEMVGVSHALERSPSLMSLLDDDRLHGIPEGIIGPDFIHEGSHAQLYVGDTPWHGGAGTIVKWPMPHIKVSIYGETLNKDNGCLRVVPGSHRNYLRMIDSRWSMAPDYMDIIRYGRSQAEDFKPFGLEPTEVPCFPLETEPGDVLVHTEDILHAAFGGPPGRFQLAISFMADPTTDEQTYYVKERNVYGGEFRPSETLVNSNRPRIRRMVSRLVELGFEPVKI